MRNRYWALPLTLVSAPVLAHDFWLQPFRYQTAPGAPVAATFQVGHGATRQRWGVDVGRVLMFADFYNGVRRDRRASLRSRGPADLVTTLTEPGLHVLAMETSYSVSELPAIRFNDYAKQEGLTPIITTRRRTSQEGLPGRERYSRRAKALVQVGSQTTANSFAALRPIGLKLEIVPTRNPYALDSSRQLPVQVFYNGRPLANATVKLTSLEADARPVAISKTDRAGRTNFHIPTTGSWLLNVVWAEPVRGDPKVEFDTTFSSLTFGYGPTPRRR